MAEKQNFVLWIQFHCIHKNRCRDIAKDIETRFDTYEFRQKV